MPALGKTTKPDGVQVKVEACQDEVERALQLALDVYVGLSIEEITEVEKIVLDRRNF